MQPTTSIVAPQTTPTGIEGLDALLHGGFPQGRTHMIAGEPGTGKTTMSLQFLMSGAQKGDRCLYITVDEKPEQIIANANSLGWDLKGLLEKGTLSFLDLTGYFGSRRILSGRYNFDHIVDNIVGFIQDKKIQRLAIDPITPLIFSIQNHSDITYYIRKLIFKLEDFADCTSLLVSPIPVGTNKLSIHGMVEFLTSGVLHLRQKKLVRILTIRKMRGIPIGMVDYNFEILPERGIILRQAL